MIGQEVLVKTLSYCISHKKLAGAILLTGIRGVGKTSSARIIAKTVNCTSPVIVPAENGNNVTPCEICKNCESARNGNHPDIIEIDAASKTSVDDIRVIIESSEYRPLLGEYKLFIIDEVHMLSKNAFNALLKLIEEPPAHVIFIFATTEAQKIPLTIISRCQRYDLRRFSFAEILALLQKVAKAENLSYTEEALKIIAQKSEGSARDAISILDQASGYMTGNNNQRGGADYVIDAELISRMLGLVQNSTILKLVKLIIAGNTKSAISLLEEIYLDASNMEYFIQQIADFIASLIKQKMIKDFHDPLYSEQLPEISVLLAGMSISRLGILWQIFSSGVSEIKASHNGLITAQMLVIKAIHSCNIPKIEQLIDVSDTSQEQMPLTQDQEQSHVQEQNIFEFLRFCHEQNEMDLYYALLNEIEVKSFGKGVMLIASNSKVLFEKQLRTMLNRWSGQEWTLQINTQDQIRSLKQALLDKAYLSEDFAIIKNNFPNADISDIILKL